MQNLNLPIDLQLQLFKHTFLPITLYGCVIWVWKNFKINSLGTCISQIPGNLLQLIYYMQNLTTRLLVSKSKPE